MHGKSYEEVQVQKLQVRIELYRMIHMEAMEPNETISTIWSRIKDIREVSDVLGCQSEWGTVSVLCE